MADINDLCRFAIVLSGECDFGGEVEELVALLKKVTKTDTNKVQTVIYMYAIVELWEYLGELMVSRGNLAKAPKIMEAFAEARTHRDFAQALLLILETNAS